MKTNVEWGEAESKASGTHVLYQARTADASLSASQIAHEAGREESVYLHA